MKQPRFADDKIVFDVSEGRVLPVLASAFFVATGVAMSRVTTPSRPVCRALAMTTCGASASGRG